MSWHDFSTCPGCDFCDAEAERRAEEREHGYDASDAECEAAARDMVFGRQW